MLRNQYAMPFRKRPRPKMHKFYPYVSHMNDVCHDDHICNDCMACYAAEAEHNRPGHAWAVDDGKVIYLEDVVVEHHLGRKLTTKEGVLHKDGNVLNNKLENLEVINIENLENE